MQNLYIFEEPGTCCPLQFLAPGFVPSLAVGFPLPSGLGDVWSINQHFTVAENFFLKLKADKI